MSAIRARILLFLTFSVLSATGVGAQTAAPVLSLESIFSPDPEVRIEFGGSPLENLAWTPDSKAFLQPTETGKLFRSPLRAAVGDGKTTPLLDLDRMVRSLAALPDFPLQDAKRLLKSEVKISPECDDLLIERAGDLFHYAIDARKATRLTHGDGKTELANFSPDGHQVAFVRAHELYVVSVDTGLETAMTADGGPTVLNGKLDWVYQEEIYGRGNFKGYWWSPDSERIALLQLDESSVGQFTLIDHIPTRVTAEVMRYPKAGDPNPEVRLGVVSRSGGETVWVETSKYKTGQHLIVRVDWTRNASEVVFLVQNREQTWLDINLADARTGTMTTLLRETSPAFVDVDLTGGPFFLKDGSFLWVSGRSGYHHLYHFAASGKSVRQLTEGDWEVRQIYGVDEESGWIYFSASEHSPIEDHVYRIRHDGTGIRRLSRVAGNHEALFAPDFSYYLDTWSDYDTPRQISLHLSDGSLVRVVDDNPVAALEEIPLATTEFMQVPASDGFLLEAAWILPPDFDPKETYPVLQYNYGGPHAQTVRNSWGGSRHVWLRYLAQEGYVIWMCDNRSASGKGIWPTWEAYGRLGEIELADIESCLAWLKKRPWVDPDRIGIYGGSYGGFMSAFALTHSKSFKVGIAFAPVTDWHLYDSVYTERYMRLPQDNPEGYEATSVIKAAGELHGELLLIHGTMDDNVHLQNSLKLADALQRAGKSFDLMLYPTARHGVRDLAQVYHWYGLMTRFLIEKL